MCRAGATVCHGEGVTAPMLVMTSSSNKNGMSAETTSSITGKKALSGVGMRVGARLDSFSEAEDASRACRAQIFVRGHAKCQSFLSSYDASACSGVNACPQEGLG